ncbi:Inner membrane metabolite transport protein YhjE [compost metagenome]
MVVKAVTASAVGTAIEWYDFFLYGVAAALVFPKLFFPESDPFTAVLLAFSTYFVGFVARPVGAAIFGHWGDRIGRKATLVATLLLMGAATFAIGLMPTYATIGVWGGVALTVLRVIQGIGVGGEWGGSVLMSLEWGEGGKRGFLASWPQFGAPLGMLLANGAVAGMSALSGPAFLEWGWRVPFLASALLIGVGLYIRLGVMETPVFSRMAAEKRVEAAPVATVIRRHWREIALTAFVRSGQQAPFYIFTTFVLVYGTQALGLPRGTILQDVMVASAVALFTVPFWGWVSDRIGRRRMTMIGAAVMAVWIFAYFAMLDSRQPWLIFGAIALSLAVHDMQYGPQAAFIAEAFPARLRYSGASLGYQLASLTAGGPAPMIALWLYESTKSSWPIAVYIALCAIISLVAAAFLPDRSQVVLDPHLEEDTDRLATNF